MSLVVVSGAIANKPHQGGSAWVRLSYLRGLRRLGYRVHFIEQIAPSACVDAAGSPAPLEASANRAYFDRVMAEFQLGDCATLLATDDRGEATIPPSLVELGESADALINISGHLAIKPLLERFRNRVFLDIDPGFTQTWHSSGNAAARLGGHDHYYTIGLNIGRPDCPIPSGGIPWRPTVPPVVLSDWPATATNGPLRFTTIANWRGPYGPIEFDGRTLGVKVHEFRKVMELPGLLPSTFEVALNIDAGDDRDRTALDSCGWRINDPLEVAGTPARFRRYVEESGAEFSVAQSVYVETRSGWFSDRSTRYLASGKPVLVQDTGFSRHLPTGQGIVPFSTLDEAIAGARSIAADYAGHCEAARRIAEQCFDSDKVLGRLMEEIGVQP
jgi:hypothetical protein